ncbi:cytidine deaminase [Termitidicoccus mucosus]|uniref:Cytidine deaminase n=1 Tax=Termitidicoccus mucosus TaxID=1184151 RepID=A0A178IFR1_9BACT|nr:cytidine deaminase [Opitutaceae bacterium TSB47]
MKPSPSAPVLRRLEKNAREASARAYAPYSKFAVGAAVLAGSGKIYAGCNVENACYGLGICAERAAVFAAVAAGERAIRCVVIHTPTATPTAPCGACRQVINEFGPEARVVSVCAAAGRIDTTLDKLLPGAFGPGNLDL